MVSTASAFSSYRVQRWPSWASSPASAALPTRACRDSGGRALGTLRALLSCGGSAARLEPRRRRGGQSHASAPRPRRIASGCRAECHAHRGTPPSADCHTADATRAVRRAIGIATHQDISAQAVWRETVACGARNFQPLSDPLAPSVCRDLRAASRMTRFTKILSPAERRTISAAGARGANPTSQHQLPDSRPSRIPSHGDQREMAFLR